jgi:hypothetical protein
VLQAPGDTSDSRQFVLTRSRGSSPQTEFGHLPLKADQLDGIEIKRYAVGADLRTIVEAKGIFAPPVAAVQSGRTGR